MKLEEKVKINEKFHNIINELNALWTLVIEGFEEEGKEIE